MGSVQHVVTIVVILDHLAQLGDALGGVHGIGLLNQRNIAVRAKCRHGDREVAALDMYGVFGELPGDAPVQFSTGTSLTVSRVPVASA